MNKYLKILISCIIFTGGAFAGDIYNLVISSKSPVFKRSNNHVYKDFTGSRFNGFINLEYNKDGTVRDECEAVIYGNFPEGKVCRYVIINTAICNIYGKNKDKVEALFYIDDVDFVITLSGTGKIKKQKTTSTCSACSVGSDDECSDSIYINNISGNFTGTISMLCVICGYKPWAWRFNECLSNELVFSVPDALYGSWRIRYNKKLTKTCGDNFKNGIVNFVPNQYTLTF